MLVTLTKGSRCSRCGQQAYAAYNHLPLCGYCLRIFEQERDRRRSMVGRFSAEVVDAVCVGNLQAIERLLPRGSNPSWQNAGVDTDLDEATDLKNAAMAAPFIERYASACLPADGPWPAPFEMPDPDDILALQTLLQNDGVAVTADRLFCLVCREIAGQRRRQFSQSFLKRNRHLPSQPTLKEWADAFVNTFQNNLDHLSDLADMIEVCGVQVDRQKLADLVNQAILARSQEHRTEKILQAIRAGTPIRRLAIEDVDGMDGLEFEQFLCRLFKALGYQAQVTRASGDQGADLLLEKFDERTVVQAKRYTDRVPNSAIQEVVAAKAQYGCHHAMVVSNSYFTSSALELAAANRVALWDRDRLASTISMYL